MGLALPPRMLALRGRALVPLPAALAPTTRSLSTLAEIRPPAKRRRRTAPSLLRRHASSSTPGPSARYDELVQAGTLRDDEFQRGVVGMLQELHDEIEAYEPPDIPDPKLESRSFFSRFQSPTPTIPTIPDNVPKGAQRRHGMELSAQACISSATSAAARRC